MNIDQKFMQRCLELASMGWPRCKTNPMVGSVIVHNGQIIGEGYHQKYGEDHAEVVAIKAVKDKKLISESILYVNLEPCSHFGKTPPCADLIIKMGIPRVVIASIDTTSNVSGKGIERMRKAGIEVKLGLMEKEARALNKRFFCFNEKKRPYIILKWAESEDGFMDKHRTTDAQKPSKISGTLVQQMVHQWRSEEESIMVGGNTLRLDNPQLNVRQVKGRNPLRIVISPSGELPKDSLVFIDGQPTVVFSSAIREESDSVEWIALDFARGDSYWINQLMAILHKRNIQSVFIEGGSTLLLSFLAANIWDEARRIKSDLILGDGVPSPKIDGEYHHQLEVGNDRIEFYRNI